MKACFLGLTVRNCAQKLQPENVKQLACLCFIRSQSSHVRSRPDSANFYWPDRLASVIITNQEVTYFHLLLHLWCIDRQSLIFMNCRACTRWCIVRAGCTDSWVSWLVIVVEPAQLHSSLTCLYVCIYSTAVWLSTFYRLVAVGGLVAALCHPHDAQQRSAKSALRTHFRRAFTRWLAPRNDYKGKNRSAFSSDEGPVDVGSLTPQHRQACVWTMWTMKWAVSAYIRVIKREKKTIFHRPSWFRLVFMNVSLVYML